MLEKELRDQVAFREWIKDPGDPELKELFDEIEEMNARHDAALKKAKDASDRLGELLDIKDEEKTVIGYGASAKFTQVTNMCGINDELILNFN